MPLKSFISTPSQPAFSYRISSDVTTPKDNRAMLHIPGVLGCPAEAAAVALAGKRQSGGDHAHEWEPTCCNQGVQEAPEPALRLQLQDDVQKQRGGRRHPLLLLLPDSLLHL